MIARQDSAATRRRRPRHRAEIPPRERAGHALARRRRVAGKKPQQPADKAAHSAHCFDEHVLPHRQSLYATALKLTKQPNDAEDLVQDTLLRAYVAWSSFEPGSNCRAWLFRILTNSFINNYRRRRRHTRFARECPEDALTALYGNSHHKARDPERQLLEHTLGDEVTAALAGLGEDYRRVVELADLRGIRYRDIAEVLDLPIGTVMSRLFRARRQLEAQLTEFAAADYGIRRAA